MGLPSSSASISLTVKNSFFTAARAALCRVVGNSTGTNTVGVTITGTAFSNSNASAFNNSESVLLEILGNNSTLTFDVENNTFTGSGSDELEIDKLSDTHTQ